MWTAIGTAVSAIVVGLVGLWWKIRSDRKKDERDIKAAIKPFKDAHEAEEFKARARSARASRRRLSRLQRASRENKLTVRGGVSRTDGGKAG